MKVTESSTFWYVVLTVTMFLWSSNYVIFKFVLVEVGPEIVALYRWAFASCALGIYFVIRRSFLPKNTLSKREIALLIVGSFFGVVATWLALLYGVHLAGATVPAILINSNIVVVAVMTWFLKKETMSYKKMFGIIIGVFGIMVTLWPQIQLGDKALLGGLIVLIATIGVAIHTVIGKELIPKISAIRYTLFTIAPAGLVIAPVVIIQGGASSLIVSSPAAILGLMYTGLVGTAVTWLVFSYSLDHVPASSAAAFKMLIPPLSAFLAVLFLNEPFAMVTALGMVSIMIGIILINRYTRTYE